MSQSDKYIAPPNIPISEWRYPEPSGVMDRFIGPGATKAELWLQFLPTFIIASVVTIWAAFQYENWNWWQWIVYWVLIVDMVGGVITNATSSAKRWYHKRQTKNSDHLKFVLLHALQPFLIVILFAPENWIYFFGTFVWLLLGACIILKLPVYLQRPAAGAWVVGGIFLEQLILSTPAGFEWFFAVYLIKVLVSHLLCEPPYSNSPTR